VEEGRSPHGSAGIEIRYSAVLSERNSKGGKPVVSQKMLYLKREKGEGEGDLGKKIAEGGSSAGGHRFLDIVRRERTSHDSTGEVDWVPLGKVREKIEKWRRRRSF